MPAPIALAAVRVPCPLCRKPIHPIAGRCRHCHGDVVGKIAPAPPPARPPRARLGYLAALVVTALVAAGLQLAVV